MYSDTREFIQYLMIAGLVIILGCILGVRGIQELSVPGTQAAIEQLRNDVIHVTHGENEDVIGQVTQWNQQIASKKQYRTLWYGRLCIPKAWETIDLIPLQ